MPATTETSALVLGFLGINATPVQIAGIINGELAEIKVFIQIYQHSRAL